MRFHFEKFGELSDIAIMIDKRTGQPRGFGFITMKDPAAADIVVSTEHTIDGRVVDVKRAVPRDMAPAPTRAESKKIFVGGLPTEVTEKEFADYFSTFGLVKDVVVMVDRATNRSRGFGFVTFETEEAVEAVLRNKCEIMGKWVEVKRAEPRDARSESGPRGNGMGGGGGGMGGGGGGGSPMRGGYDGNGGMNGQGRGGGGMGMQGGRGGGGHMGGGGGGGYGTGNGGRGGANGGGGYYGNNNGNHNSSPPNQLHPYDNNGPGQGGPGMHPLGGGQGYHGNGAMRYPNGNGQVVYLQHTSKSVTIVTWSFTYLLTYLRTTHFPLSYNPPLSIITHVLLTHHNPTSPLPI